MNNLKIETNQHLSKKTRLIMGMPITLAFRGPVDSQIMTKVFDYFNLIDQRFSTYKTDSEISKINRHELTLSQSSDLMQEVFSLCDITKKITFGYFDIVRPDGLIDPSGLVKGWAIDNAAHLIQTEGYDDFYIEAGGDIALGPRGSWLVGVRNPFDITKNLLNIELCQRAIATSGTYLRGQHIYNPLTKRSANELVSLSVIGPNIFEADRLATAAFAMGLEKGLVYLDLLPDFEACFVDFAKNIYYTQGFLNYAQ